MMVYLVLVIFFAIFLRFWVKKDIKNSISSDGYFHLYIKNHIDIFRDDSKKVSRLMLPHKITYPYLFHYLISFIPKKYDLEIDKYSSLIFDTLMIISAYFTFLYISSSYEIAILGAFVLAVSPVLLRVSNAPRAYNVTPRVFGEFLFVVFIEGLVLFKFDANYMWIIMSVVSGIFILLSSKFTNQALLFFSLGFLAIGEHLMFEVLFISVIVAVIFFKRDFFDSIYGQVKHSIFYFKYNQKKYLWTTRLSFADYLKLIKTKLKDKLFLQWIYQENAWYHQVVFVYWSVIVIFYLYFTQESSSDLIDYMIMWLVISSILMLITSFKYFMFLGEAERYMEHTVLLQAFLIAYFSVEKSHYWFIVLYILYSLVGYFYFKKIYKLYFTKWSEFYSEVNNIFHSIDKEDKIIYPIGGMHWIILYFSKRVKVLFGGVNNDESLFSYKEWKKLYGNYPYPSSTIKDVRKEYHFDYILIKKEDIKTYQKRFKDDIFDSSRLKTVAESKSLVIYEWIK